MPKYWLISDRDGQGTGPGRNDSGLTFWVSDGGPLDKITNWQNVSAPEFQTLLRAATDQFPPDKGDDQRHVTILIHGFNNKFTSANKLYQELCGRLFEGPGSLGLCILYDWPLVDEKHARASGEALADVLSGFLDWVPRKEPAVFTEACRAKLSVIAHGAGNPVLKKAMSVTWNTKYQPVLVNWVSELLMVAADVESDLFDVGTPGYAEGIGILNLSRRITALYSGRDAGLLSFGLSDSSRARLGRSGLMNRPPVVNQPPLVDNVWDIDCSSFFPSSVRSTDIHGAYFLTDGVLHLMRQILRGMDRGVLEKLGYTRGTAWP